MLQNRRYIPYRLIISISITVIVLAVSGCANISKPSEASLKDYIEARELYRSGNSEDSIKLLTEIISHEKNKFPQAKILLGRIYYLQGKDDEALALFEALYKKDHSHQEAGLWLVKTLIAQDKLPEAINAIEELLSKNPEDPRLLYQMARIYSKQEKYSQALDYYGAAADYSEELALSHLKRGEIYKTLGDQDKALIELTRAVSVIPSNSPMAKPIITLYRDLKKQESQ